MKRKQENWTSVEFLAASFRWRLPPNCRGCANAYCPMNRLKVAGVSFLPADNSRQ